MNIEQSPPRALPDVSSGDREDSPSRRESNGAGRSFFRMAIPRADDASALPQINVGDGNEKGFRAMRKEWRSVLAGRRSDVRRREFGIAGQ